MMRLDANHYDMYVLLLCVVREFNKVSGLYIHSILNNSAFSCEGNTSTTVTSAVYNSTTIAIIMGCLMGFLLLIIVTVILGICICHHGRMCRRNVERRNTGEILMHKLQVYTHKYIYSGSSRIDQGLHVKLSSCLYVPHGPTYIADTLVHKNIVVYIHVNVNMLYTSPCDEQEDLAHTFECTEMCCNWVN